MSSRANFLPAFNFNAGKIWCPNLILLRLSIYSEKESVSWLGEQTVQILIRSLVDSEHRHHVLLNRFFVLLTLSLTITRRPEFSTVNCCSLLSWFYQFSMCARRLWTLAILPLNHSLNHWPCRCHKNVFLQNASLIKYPRLIFENKFIIQTYFLHSIKFDQTVNHIYCVNHMNTDNAQITAIISTRFIRTPNV